MARKGEIKGGQYRVDLQAERTLQMLESALENVSMLLDRGKREAHPDVHTWRAEVLRHVRRFMGSQGGKARAKALSAARRREIARMGGKAKAAKRGGK